MRTAAVVLFAASILLAGSVLEAASNQFEATVKANDHTFVCRAVLIEIPSHEVSVDRLLKGLVGDTATARWGNQDSSGSGIEYQLSARVNRGSEKALVSLRTDHYLKGVRTRYSTSNVTVPVETAKP